MRSVVAVLVIAVVAAVVGEHLGVVGPDVGGLGEGQRGEVGERGGVVAGVGNGGRRERDLVDALLLGGAHRVAVFVFGTAGENQRAGDGEDADGSADGTGTCARSHNGQTLRCDPM